MTAAQMKVMGHRKSAPSLAPNQPRSFRHCGQQLKYRTRLRHHQRCRWIPRRQIRDGRKPGDKVTTGEFTQLSREGCNSHSIKEANICFWVRFLPRILQWESAGVLAVTDAFFNEPGYKSQQGRAHLAAGSKALTDDTCIYFSM